ncbi:MAG TPA: endonuclease/exonuclease/phosphatase family protein [Acidimicrobiia bacterium]
MPTLRFATANLFTRFVDTDHLDAVLDEVDPDLLVTLELAPKAAEVIAAHYDRHHLRPEQGFEGWGVAGRFDLEADGQAGWGRGGAFRVDLPGSALNLAAVHLLDPMHTPRKVVTVRRRQVEALLEWGRSRPQGEPQLVAGDFNASPTWPAYRRLAGHWTDLVAEAGRARRTWGFPPGVRLFRIDHVLGSGLRAVDAGVVRVRGSDHAMVVVDLEVG